MCSGDQFALDDRAEALSRAGNTTLLLKPFSLEAVEEVVSRGLADGYGTPAAHVHAAAAS